MYNTFHDTCWGESVVEFYLNSKWKLTSKLYSSKVAWDVNNNWDHQKVHGKFKFLGFWVQHIFDILPVSKLCSSKKPWTYRNLLSFYFIQHKSEPLTLYRYNCSKYGNFIQIMFIKYTWCQVKLTLAAKIQHLSTRRHTGEVGSHLIIDKLSSYSALTESVLYNRAGTKFHFKICGYHNYH